ncbi:Uncharacterized protein Rs2_02783 [Raphanus sativus]|nr:Uncharacterized protein Rs2_02783 [Raphanus sativus]
MDLRYSREEKGKSHIDATQDPDQDQLDDQDAQIRRTEVHPSVQAKQSNRAVYRINPRSSGKELRMDPRPDDRSDRTTDDLSRLTRQDKANRRARLHLDQAESDHDRNFSLLTRLVRTAHPDDRTNVLTSSFDAIMDFSSTKFSKARILRLSEDLGRVNSSYVQDSSMITSAAAPPYVHLLTATNQISTDALGHLSESGPVNL